MQKKTLFVVVVQTVIIIGLVWLLAFYGRDEYEQVRLADQNESEARSNVVEQAGLQMIKMNQATQLNSGILLAPLQPYAYQGKTKALGTVVSIQPLIDYSSQYQALLAQLRLAESTLPNHQLQYQRFKQLNEDDKNISDKAVQEANALVIADQTQIATSKQQLAALKANIEAQWGTALAALITQKSPPAQLQALLQQQTVLVQVSLPNQAPAPQANATLTLTPLHDETKFISARYVSQSIQSDISNLGKTYYFIAPAEDLRVGMRVSVISDQKQRALQKGVRVPNDAIVWNAGLAWVYLKTAEDTFLRKPVSVTTEIDGGWFDDSLPAGAEVVVRGAQLLLSEEFKFLIKNENDD